MSENIVEFVLLVVLVIVEFDITLLSFNAQLNPTPSPTPSPTVAEAPTAITAPQTQHEDNSGAWENGLGMFITPAKFNILNVSPMVMSYIRRKNLVTVLCFSQGDLFFCFLGINLDSAGKSILII